MPFFVPDESAPETRLPAGVAPSPHRVVTAGETIAAAFRQENPLSSLYMRLNEETFAPEPGHNPLDIIRDTPFEDRYLSRFVGSRSESETRAIMRRIDREEADQRTLEASGLAGTVAQFGAGMIDPTIALPGGAIVKSARGGYSAARSAIGIGAAAGFQSLVQEGVLQATHETRTALESATAIGSSTLLGGLIGAGAARLLSTAERKALETALDTERAAMAAHAGQTEKPASGLPTGDLTQAPVARAAGAAATDVRQLDMFRTGLEFSAGLSPTRRTLSGGSVEARRAMADLAETPYRFKENESGVAVGQGPALDRLVRMETTGARVQVADEFDRLFSDYRFGSPDITLPRVRAQIDRLTGANPDKMDFTTFKSEVARALQEGDTHAIPQVEQAAQYVRRRVFDPWKERAIAAGLLPEGVNVKTAESYFMRVYNKEKIAARRPEFVDRVTEWLTSDQAAKQAAKERLVAFNNGLGVAQEQIKRLQAKIEALSADVDVVEARREEATRINKFAFERSTQLRESEFQNVGGIRVDVPGKNIEKARGGAVFETKVRDRGNVLSDRVSGKLAEIDALEQKLASEISNHDKARTKIEAELAAWEGKSAAEAKSALKAREKYAAARAAKAAEDGKPEPTTRLTSADDAIDRAVKAIIASDRELPRETLRDLSQEITDRVLGSPDGRLPYDAPSGGPEIGFRGDSGQPPRGPLAARNFAIPDALIRDFLESDVERVTNTYLRTIVPDVLLTERFGDVRMTEAFRRINDEYASMVGTAKSEKARTALEKERQAAIRDIAAIRDRVRGVYGWSPDLRNAARVANAAKSINNLQSMGVAAISSLPDFAGAIFRNGFSTVFNDGWAPFFKSLAGSGEGWDKAKAQWRAVGIGVETTTNARQHAIDDVMDLYRPESRVERALQFASDKFFVANLLAPLTDFQKTVAANVSVAEILRATKAVTENKATKRQISNLAEGGIDPAMASRIWRNFQDGGGQVIDGVHLPNTGDWTDKSAASALNGAVAREVDIAVVTPGQEKPLWMSQPVISLLGQFKAFTASSTERILIANLQRRDAATLSGLLFSLSLGMLSYKLNSVFGGQKTSDRPQDWVKEGISRSGVLGWFEEGNALASKMSRGGVDIYRAIGADKPLSRYASRSTLDMFLGPTAGKVQALTQATGAAASREWTESDTNAVRKLVAFQNLFYLRGLINHVEEGVNGAFGIPMRQKPQ